MNKHNISQSFRSMHQLFILSGLLMELGYRSLALSVQSNDGWDYIDDCVRLIKSEAANKRDSSLLNRLHDADLI